MRAALFLLPLLVIMKTAVSQNPEQSTDADAYERIMAFTEDRKLRFTVNDVSRLEDIYGIEGRKKTMQRLNALFSDVHRHFTPHRNRSRQEAMDFFTTVDSLLDEHHISQFYMSESFDGDFFNRTLSKPYKGVPCYYISLIYNSLGKIYPFSIFPVLASDHHIFVRYQWAGKDSSLNWETTIGESRPDRHYIKKNELSRQAINSGCYLRCLSDRQALATLFRYMGVIEQDKGHDSTMFKFYKKAWQLDTTRLNSLYALSACHSELGEPDSALYYLDKAHAMDTANARTWLAYGFIYEENNHTDKAIDAYDHALQLDSLYGRALYKRARIALDRDHREKFKQLYERLMINDAGNLPYILRLDKLLNTKKNSIHME